MRSTLGLLGRFLSPFKGDRPANAKFQPLKGEGFKPVDNALDVFLPNFSIRNDLVISPVRLCSKDRVFR